MRHTNQILDQLPAGSEIDRVMLLDYFQKIIGVVILRAAPSSLKALADLQIPEGNISRHLDLFHSVLTVPVNPIYPSRLYSFPFVITWWTTLQKSKSSTSQ